MSLGGRCAATALLVVGALAMPACGSNEPEPVESVPAMGFVERFAPLVHLQAEEGSFPMTADSFLDHSMLSWSDGEGGGRPVAVGVGRRGQDDVVVPLLSAARLGSRTPPNYEQRLGSRPGCVRLCRTILVSSGDPTRPFGTGREKRMREGEGFYLDLLYNWHYGEANLSREEGQEVLQDLPVYTDVEEVRHRGGLALLVTYWMLFGVEEPLADGAPTHEGDWERIAVLLRRAERGARYEPVEVRYYQRGHRVTVPWGDAEVVESPESAATHPVVYMGLADHTPHPRPVDRRRRVSFGARAVLLRERAESCADCPQWRTWERLVNGDTEPWYGYGGAWGALGLEDATTGPAGPSVWVER